MAFRATLAKASEGGLFATLSNWAKNASGYRKYGLVADDLIREEISGVKEALARLPQTVQDERYFRIKRAMNLSLKHQYLPKEEWTTDSQDVQYLSPMLELVQKEIDQKAKYDFKY